MNYLSTIILACLITVLSLGAQNNNQIAGKWKYKSSNDMINIIPDVPLSSGE